uniref:Transmembrane protein n=1 Tax=Medicago truncatula TaxID=3880 RepID=A2Q1T4_MEDTR|nr:hypothetical protein MtrDRAFT_AC149040g44v2 [Medicago truncatula]
MQVYLYLIFSCTFVLYAATNALAILFIVVVVPEPKVKALNNCRQPLTRRMFVICIVFVGRTKDES